MEDNTGITLETVDTGDQSAGGEFQQREVLASEILAPQQNAETKPQSAKGATQTSQPRNGGAHPQQEQKIETQQDIDRRLGYRIREERTKAETAIKASAPYTLGEMLLNEYMEQNGVSAEEAARRILNERADRKAEEAAKDPKKFYRDMYAQQGAAQRPQQQQRQAAPQPEQGSDLESELQYAVSSGALPQGFMPEHIDQFFVNDAKAFGLQYAFDRWEQSNGTRPQYQPAAQRVPQQQPMQQQRQQPATKPMRVQGTDATVKPLDFSTESMDSKTFQETYAKLRQAAARGDKVVLR